MTPKERAAMQQALEALESCVEKFYAMKSTGVIGALPMQAVKAAQAITALREALEHPNEIDWIETNKALAKEIIELKKQIEQPVSQEPVAWLIDWPDEPELGHYFAEQPNEIARSRPLYAAPVRLKDITDDEIAAIVREAARGSAINRDGSTSHRIARAVIAAYKEKNK